jgi:EAL domain-containing protein (putative c-di-GMP-specific phosphodiesterase class I)
VAWRTEHRSLTVAVNLAARQLSLPDITSVVAAALRDTGARPDELVLEITESAVLMDAVAASERLAAVRRMGVRVSIDDFGTGFSSLSYLQRLPIDELKVDRSFVAPLTRDQPSSAIVESIIGLAHAVGLTVVAEGVETLEQLAELERLGCDEAQGYLLARPQTSTAITPLLSTPLGPRARVEARSL